MPNSNWRYLLRLLIFKLDRLGRDTRLILNTVAELEKHGVRVRSMTEEFDTAGRKTIRRSILENSIFIGFP
jgi:DNA invertase Pin-like site-specific DNA recombinase